MSDWSNASDPNTAGADVVTVRDLTKAYHGHRAVDGVDLAVGTGEIVGLIGANGAGKTTTVECIQGLRRPDGGSIRVLGLDPTTDGERVRASVGSQLQSAGLPERMRVGEAVRLFAGRNDDQLLEQFGLAERRRSAFAALSGGERQRLFLVLALVNRPRLVILDELTQGLDPAARRNVWAAVDQLRRRGTSILLVTHELDEAQRLCDRVVALRRGRVLDQGTPAELVDRYGGPTTIRFSLPRSALAAARLTGRVRQLPGVDRVHAGAGRVTVTGRRIAIAHVGAELVRTNWMPPDLAVSIPSLDDALVDLLERADDSDETPRRLVGTAPDRQPSSTPELIGAIR